MSSSSSEKPRIHPSFPTPNETAENPEIAFSDHLPILAQVLLANDQPFRVISLNILGGVHMSGVHQPGSSETDEQITRRYERIAAGLKKAIAKHGVDALLLQEADSRPAIDAEPYILPVLRAALGEEWEVLLPEDDQKKSRGLVTCYKKAAWTLDGQELNSKNRIHTMSLIHKGTAASVSVGNIWGNFEHAPIRLETQCREALQSSVGRSGTALIIGDTNSRIAPLDMRVRNITTGAIPLAINEENGVPQGVQTSDYPDGGFYRGEDGRIHQLETSILDFQSGEIIEDERAIEQVSPWLEPRMVMCLDDSHTKNKVFGKRTLFEYEDFLRSEFNSQNILIRFASDCFNQKSVGICFPKKLKEDRLFIQEKLKSPDNYSVRSLPDNKTGVVFDYLFVPMDKLPLLQNAIEECLTKKRVPEVVADTKGVSATQEGVFRNWIRDAMIGFAVAFVAIALFTGLGFVTGGVFPLAAGPLAISFLGAATGTGLAGGMGIFAAIAVGASALVGAVSVVIGGLRNKFFGGQTDSSKLSLSSERAPLLLDNTLEETPENPPPRFHYGSVHRVEPIEQHMGSQPEPTEHTDIKNQNKPC